MKTLGLLSYSALASVARAGIFQERGVLHRRQEAAGETSTSFPGASTLTSVGATSTEVEFTSTATELTIHGTTTTWTADSSGASTDVIVSGVTTTLSLEGTTADIVLTQSTVVELSLDGLTTNWAVADASTDVTLEGTATTLTVTGSTSVQWIVSPTSTEVTYSGTTISFSSVADASTSAVTVDGTTITLALEAATTAVSLDGTEVGLSYEGTEVTLTLSSSETSSSSEEESSSTEETSSTNTESGSTSANVTVTTSGVTQPTSNPTYCEVTRNTLTPEEEVQLAVLFGDSTGGTTFADYVVSYASQLIAQIDSVANIAVGDNNYAFTTAFDTIDIPGVLGLASAAPIYTCFLSSLWAQALANPQQYAKRAVPTEDEKIKLIVLFEKRATDGMQFDYAELLVDDTNSLISDVQSVSAAAANGDLSAYASLFANVDVAQFLSIATQAPVYTEGLSSAFVTAFESYSQSLRPTVTAMTTATYTTISTIVTNVVSGTLTIPTTYYSTVVATSVGPVSGTEQTRTSRTTETRMNVTSETVSMIVRESTLPNGQVTRVTETVVAGAPAATGERVTVEVVTLANGRVETRTVTIRGEGVPATTRAVTTRPNIAVYTQVQNGVTYTHTIEIQTKNAAFKKVAALGAGFMGAAALFL